MQNRELDSELGAFAPFTLALDFSVVQVDNLLDVGQTQSEAFHVVHITSMDAVEFVEDFLHVFFLDTLSVVADGEAEMFALVPCTDMDIDGLVCLAILHSVVQQVGDGILEMHFIHEDGRVNGFYLCVDLAAC